MKSRKRIFLFYPLLISIILIAVPGMTSVFSMMKISVKHSISMAETANERLLAHIRDQIDSVLHEQEKISNSLILHPGINRLLRFDSSNDGDTGYYKIYDVQSNLPRYELTSEFISSIEIVYRKSGLILSASGSYVDIFSCYYQNIFPDAEKGEGHRLLWDSIHRNKVFSTSTGLWFVSSFPLDVLHPQALIVIRLNEDAFSRVLSLFDIGKSGMIEIISEGSVVFSYPDEKVGLEQEKMVVNRVRSLWGDWEIQSLVPYSHIIKPVYEIRKYEVLITLLSIFVTIILSVLLIKWNSRPLLTLLRKLVKEEEGSKTEVGNGYEVINTHVDNMLQESFSMKERLSQQEGFLRQSYIGNIIHGDFMDSEESIVLTDIVGLTEDMFPVAVFIIKETSLKSRAGNIYSFQKKIVTELTRVFNTIVKLEIITYPLEEGGLCCLISTLHTVNVLSLLETSFNNYLKESESKSVALFWGGLGESAEGIHIAFSNAEKMLLQAYSDESGFITNENKVHKIPAYSFSIECEVKLLTYIRAGNTERARLLLDDIEISVFKDPGVSIYIQRQLIRNLTGTLLRLSQDIDDFIDDSEPIHTVFQKLKALLIDKSYIVLKQRTVIDQELKDEISGFLMINFSDSTLTIHQLAEYTDLSENIFYNTFKHLFGKTFASYLESLRISKGTELLEQGYKINDVARMTGFTNPQTFRRVFKKLSGIPPSQFSKSL
ncbi:MULTISPECIES: helix-turn-helix transcriptional regulator [unclassified Oceanispirochaeta]|uniref:helix-turn-helix transcriptional regulator n=1 Tax=unclassified Oceanispirochaeta TaxID=2635722 RepID=UPI000E08FA9E|nr:MULTISPECIES: helix-turn-helix transcriptional regulator [unclassified Oceanispirochaeta]MBF9015525.1 AraC family transcriptional regulator [Oceanispirochaeta sp. M2]NPD71984.1 helix-turn-helix transcriptional regulator [Oceanispirochaeta sp. M1]RDG32790.1 AraC family transcriptional regulator [Oceanispirochaeta sp. M1]